MSIGVSCRKQSMRNLQNPVVGTVRHPVHLLDIYKEVIMTIFFSKNYDLNEEQYATKVQIEKKLGKKIHHKVFAIMKHEGIITARIPYVKKMDARKIGYYLTDLGKEIALAIFHRYI